MGINASFHVINLDKNITPADIVYKFIDYASVNDYKLVDQEYLSYERWERNKHLFGIAITPITCFNLEGWPYDKNWALITFSNLPEKLNGWKEYICNSLNTFIKLFLVYDTSGEYREYLFGKENNKIFISNIIQFYVPPDYFVLEKYPRRNTIGEAFARFVSNAQLGYKEVYANNNSVLNENYKHLMF